MKAIKFLENVSINDEQGIEVVSIHDAITACKIQELETLTAAYFTQHAKEERITQLQKQLKNIK